MNKSLLMTQLEQESEIMQNCIERQRKIADYKYQNAKDVKCSPLTEVFNEDEIELIKSSIRPKMKECFKNATLLCNLFPKECKYCEGLILVAGIFGTEHGFNYIRGKYVDITTELALGRSVEQEEYVTWLQIEAKTVIDKFLEAGQTYILAGLI